MSTNGDVKVIRVTPRRGALTAEPAAIQAEARELGRNLILSILKLMIDHPEDIGVSCDIGDRTTVYKVDCHPNSLGQLIGSKGKNISGLRAVLSATMARQGIRAIIEIPYFAPQGTACD